MADGNRQFNSSKTSREMKQLTKIDTLIDFNHFTFPNCLGQS